MKTIVDPKLTFISLGESFLYIRQLNSSSVTPPQEFIYYFSQ